jgi:hypothetical protein
MAIVGAIVAIILCGALGAIAAWALVSAIGLSGVVGALAAAIVAMAIALAAWIAGTVLLRLAARKR